MRAIYIFLTTLILTSCASVEIAKEVTKAAKSIKTSIQEIGKTKNNIEKEQIINQQQIEEETIIKQKKVAEINLDGKTLTELNQIIGKPQLIRYGGKTIIARFDIKRCRIFTFMNSANETPRVEYYELRNETGILLDQQEDIKKCFKEINNT